MGLAACEADLTQTDWEGLMAILTAALLISDTDIMSEACTLLVEWPDKLEELIWEDRLGQREGQIWIPELDELWRKALALYHDSPITGHLGTSGTLELVARSYWRRNMTEWVMRYI